LGCARTKVLKTVGFKGCPIHIVLRNQGNWHLRGRLCGGAKLHPWGRPRIKLEGEFQLIFKANSTLAQTTDEQPKLWDRL
jgi:hypothetical protein